MSGLLEIVLIGVALSADAMAVTAANILANPQMPRSRQMLMPLFFGLFQALMPVAGYFAGELAAGFIERYAGIVSLIILGVIGGKMIWDGLRGDDEGKSSVTIGALLLQAVATSIDAFAVGVTFAAQQTSIALAAPVIGVCTFVCCLIVLAIGRRLGSHFGSKAQVVGGVILIIIGIKNMWF